MTDDNTQELDNTPVDPAEAPAATETEAATPAAATSNVVTIKAQNPTAEEMTSLRASVSENYAFDVDVKEVRFNFKKSKDKETGIETIREAVQLAIPYPSIEGLMAIIEAGMTDEGKLQLELLMDCMADVINAAARDVLYEDTEITAANFPVDKLSWDAISKIPKAQRRGGGIPKETWESFATDYIAVMPAATSKTIEAVTNMAAILKNRLSNVKTNKPVLKLVAEQLALYAGVTTSLEEHKECVEFLIKKVDDLLNVSPADLLANL